MVKDVARSHTTAPPDDYLERCSLRTLCTNLTGKSLVSLVEILVRDLRASNQKIENIQKETWSISRSDTKESMDQFTSSCNQMTMPMSANSSLSEDLGVFSEGEESSIQMNSLQVKAEVDPREETETQVSSRKSDERAMRSISRCSMQENSSVGYRYLFRVLILFDTSFRYQIQVSILFDT